MVVLRRRMVLVLLSGLVNMIEDLSHDVSVPGKIGRIQTLVNLPVFAGDSLAIGLGGKIMLSPLERMIVQDCELLIAAFYVPLRHIFSNWVDFITQGIDESETLAAITGLTAAPTYLAWRVSGTTMYRPPLVAYNQVWNRYFRPLMHVAEIGDLSVPTDDDSLRYGRQAAHLPQVITGAAKVSFTDDDHHVSVSSNKLDLRDVKEIEARYASEIRREWFDKRYTDILSGIWGTGVNIDADERPELLWETRRWFGGYDTEGLADSNQGNLKGRGETNLGFQMPRRFFAEHGQLIVVCTVRYPVRHYDEQHYFQKHQNPSYLDIALDPELVSKQHYVDEVANDYFDTTDTSTIGQQPFGQHYRFHPNWLHPMFEEQKGYPYMDNANFVTGAKNSRFLVNSDDYDRMFENQQLGHFQVYGRAGIMCRRRTPDPIRSIYQGS